MKSSLYALTLLAASSLISPQLVAAPVSSSGWFYTTVSYTNGEASFGHMGPYSDEAACITARWDDYGNGGAVPWDGGPGCFYLYESDIGAYNEVLEHWNFQSGEGTGVPHVTIEFQELLEVVTVLIDQHGIRDYRKSLDQLSESRKRK